MHMNLVIATKNKNKIIEIGDKLSPFKNVGILSLLDFKCPPDIVEDGATFKENAGKKAAGISEFTGLPALADDSGLVIDALDGEPGVYSARYGGGNLSDTDRNMLVLEKLKDIPEDKRTARFICVIAVAVPGGPVYYADGLLEGVIINEFRGDSGFGYDPIFLIPGLNRTLAELSLEEKNRISHRALALDKAMEIIRNVFKG